MGINTVQNTSTQELRVTATSAVTSGDLIAFTEGGSVVPASAVISLPAQNVTTAGVSAVQAFVSASSNTTYGGAFSGGVTNAAQLSNGIIAYGFSGNGTTANTNVNITFRTISGGLYQPDIVISDTSVNYVRIKKLLNTGFVVQWSAGSVIKFAIYNNDGTVVKATTTVATLNASSPQRSQFAVTASGDILFAYSKATSTDFAFSRYNSSGTLQGAEVVIEAASNAENIFVLVHSGGDFIIRWYRTVTTTGTKFARYNSSGVLQGSIVTLSSSAGGTISINAEVLAWELSNGNILHIALDSSSSLATLYVYNISNTLIASSATWHGNVNTNIIETTAPSVIVNNGSITFGTLANVSTGQVKIWRANNSLQFFGSAITSAYVVNQLSSGGIMNLYSNGSAGFTIVSAGFNNTNYNYNVHSINLTGTLLGSAIAMVASQSSLHETSSFQTAEGLIAVFGRSGSVGPGYGTQNPCRKSITGVAQETVAAGAVFRCATVGTFTVNNAPAGGGYFDNRTATAPGCKGTVIGTTAVLSGLV
jgi:hypothetical protein